jgi:Rad3-related DNA helicase
MASVPWLRMQSVHELARLMAVKAAGGDWFRFEFARLLGA